MVKSHAFLFGITLALGLGGDKQNQRFMKHLFLALAATLILCACSKDDNSNPGSSTSTTPSPPSWLWGTWENTQLDYRLEGSKSTLNLTMVIATVNVLDPNASNSAMGIGLVEEKEKTDSRYVLRFGGQAWYTFEKLSSTQVRCTLQGSNSVILTKVK